VTTSVPEWPALDSGYEDQFGPIDPIVYQAAGEIWPQAAVFGEFSLQDPNEAFHLMLKAVARVSAAIASGAKVEHLKAYLLATYKHLVGNEHARRLRREQPIPESESEFGEHLVVDIVADLDRKILLREAFRQMNAEDRNLSYLLMLGYTSSEIAQELGLQPAAVRQRVHRLTLRLRKVMHIEEALETE